MGDRKSNFVFEQIHAEQIDVGGHFDSQSRKFIYLVLMQESGPIHHLKTCRQTSPLSSTYKLACRPHFLICDYYY